MMNRFPRWIALPILFISVMAILLFIPGKVYAACSVAATGVNFGIYDVFDTTAVDSTGTVTVTCDDKTRNITVTIGQSTYSGVFDPRQMKNLTSAYLLNYNLYTDKKKKSVWGDGTGGTDTVVIKNVKKNKAKTLTGYGSIPPSQNVSAGTYSDILTVTIIF